MKFPFDIDGQVFFSTFPKNIFSIDPKMGISFLRRNLKSLRNIFIVSFVSCCCCIKETLKKFLKDLRFRLKNKVPSFGSIEKIFFGKVGKNLTIKIETNFHCGSNGSTLSL